MSIRLTPSVDGAALVTGASSGIGAVDADLPALAGLALCFELETIA
jgi:short-subunit dehydrogenase